MTMLIANLKPSCRWIAIPLLLLLPDPSSFACATYRTLVPVNHSSFVVQIIDFHGHRPRNAKFLLTLPDNQVHFTTDAAGRFRVRALPPGEYTLERTDESGLLRVSLYVNESDNKNPDPVVIQWTRSHIYTRNLAGALHFFKTETEAAKPVQQGDTPWIETSKIIKGAVAGVHLELFQAGATKKIAETTTTENGDFDFQVTKPGLYEMRFRFDNEQRSKILELDSDSTSQSNLDLWVNSNGFVANGFINVLRGCD